MGDAPDPPNPFAQAAAQQGAELGASMGSSIINNPNQYNPYGSQTYSIAGYETIYDAQGKPQQVPRYNQVTTLSPDQMQLLGLNTQTQGNIGKTAVQQSAFLKDYLGKMVDPSGWQKWTTGQRAPTLQTSFANVGGPQRSIAGGGPIQKSVGNAGTVQKSIGSGGAIRQDQGPTDRAALERAMMTSYNRTQAPAEAAQQAQLAARGMSPGSEQDYRIRQGNADARGEAARQAYLASGAESRAAQDAYNQAQNQRFSQGAAQGQFANQAQQQLYQQMLNSGQFANAAQLQQFQQNAAQGQFGNQAQQQAYQQALDRAGFGNQARAQNWQMSQADASFLNNLRQGQAQETFALRNQPLNEIGALMSGSQVTNPQFNPFSAQGIGAAPIGQYMGQNYANQLQASNAQNAGLFGLGGSIFGGIGQAGGLASFFSDRRLKQDIEPTGESLAGVPLYSFRYLGQDETRIGVMADEVRPLHPDAVFKVAGFDAVDYVLLASRHQE